MKNLLTVPILGLLAASPDPQEAPYCQYQPDWRGELMVIVEYAADDPDVPWRLEPFGKLELEEVKTDRGEVLKPRIFCPKVYGSGDADPRKPNGPIMGEEEQLIVWNLSKPEQPWKSIQRLAGSYDLIHGGSLHWLPFPEELNPGDDSDPYENEHLAAAGFELKHGVRLTPQLHVRASGPMPDFDEFILRTAEGEKLISHSGRSAMNSRGRQWDLLEHDLDTLQLVVRFDDGTELTVDDLPDSPKFKRIRGSKWKKAKMSLEIARVETLTPFLEGSYTKTNPKSPDALRSFVGWRWVSAKGELIDTRFYFRAGGVTSLEALCYVPTDLPKGARLEFGVLADARTERLAFEFTDIRAPK